VSRPHALARDWIRTRGGDICQHAVANISQSFPSPANLRPLDGEPAAHRTSDRYRAKMIIASNSNRRLLAGMVPAVDSLVYRNCTKSYFSAAYGSEAKRGLNDGRCQNRTIGRSSPTVGLTVSGERARGGRLTRECCKPELATDGDRRRLFGGRSRNAVAQRLGPPAVCGATPVERASTVAVGNTAH
jgi:hypothetical protein